MDLHPRYGINVWAIIKARIAFKNTNTLKDLRKEIISAWKEIDADKDLCKKLIHSIPARAKAIIQKNRDQKRLLVIHYFFVCC